jgi:hypothetical protein
MGKTIGLETLHMPAFMVDTNQQGHDVFPGKLRQARNI